jgi:hypothetical protein
VAAWGKGEKKKGVKESKKVKSKTSIKKEHIYLFR